MKGTPFNSIILRSFCKVQDQCLQDARERKIVPNFSAPSRAVKVGIIKLNLFLCNKYSENHSQDHGEHTRDATVIPHRAEFALRRHRTKNADREDACADRRRHADQTGRDIGEGKAPP